MNLRLKLLGLQILSVGAVLTLSAKTWYSFDEYRVLSAEILESVELEQMVRQLPGGKPEKPKIKNLQEWRERLLPALRMENLSSVIQAYSEGNQRLLDRRIETFFKNESEYRKYLKPRVAYLARQCQIYAGFALTALLLSLLSSWWFFARDVLAPIAGLSRRMTDFLYNRYTYQFSVPAPNEIGHLQATFNSMAQRVLSNMDELKSLDRAKSEFLSIASHELRTPLTSIKGSLSLLKSGVVGPLNEAAANLVNIAGSETDRLIRLINDLLDLAKIEAGKFPLKREWVDLSQMVEQTFHCLEGLATSAGVRLETNEVAPIEVNIDRDRIQQVLTNLLSNAIKYSPKGGVVSVLIDLKDGEDVEVRVQDQGQGIAPEDQELLFQKFRQVTSAKNPLVKGTGLGLAIAKALIEEHGGQIGVRSGLGQGATFYFTLGQWRLRKQNEATQESSSKEAAA